MEDLGVGRPYLYHGCRGRHRCGRFGNSGTNPVDTLLSPSVERKGRERERRRCLGGKEDESWERQRGSLITNDGDARKLDQRALLVMEPDNVAYVRNWHGVTGGPAGVGAVMWMGTSTCVPLIVGNGIPRLSVSMILDDKWRAVASLHIIKYISL